MRQSTQAALLIFGLCIAGMGHSQTSSSTQEVRVLFFPDASTGNTVQKRINYSTQRPRGRLANEQNFLGQEPSNPLLKLWLEKEIKKHKNEMVPDLP